MQQAYLTCLGVSSKRHFIPIETKNKHWQRLAFFKSTNCSKKMINMRKGHDQFFVYTLLALQFLQLDDFYWLLLLLAFPRLYALQLLICSLAYHAPYLVFFQLLPASKLLFIIKLHFWVTNLFFCNTMYYYEYFIYLWESLPKC